MKTKCTLAFVLAMLVSFTSTARATSVRTGSSYGQLLGSPTQSVSIGTEYLICYPETGASVSGGCNNGGTVSGEDDLLLQITSTVSGTVEISIPDLATSSFSTGTPLFGLVTCDQGNSSGQLGSVCTPTMAGTSPGTFVPTVADNACASDLSTAATSVSGSTTTITLPTSCTGLTYATLYFDQTYPGFASVSATATAPEPSSFAMLGIGLIPLMFLSRRRLRG